MTPEEKIQLILEGKTPKEIEQVAAGVQNPAVVPLIDPATGEIANPEEVVDSENEEEPAVSLTNPLSVDPVSPSSGATKSIQQEEVEEIVEGMKIVSKHGEGQHTAKVYKDSDWNEYRVKYFKDGNHVGEDADYHSDDLDDAKSTADTELSHMNKHVAESIEESYVARHGKVSAEFVKRVAKDMFPDDKAHSPEQYAQARDTILSQEHRLSKVPKIKAQSKDMVTEDESAPELLAVDANLTEEYKTKAKEMFEEEVNRRVAEQVKAIQEEAEQKIVAIAEDLQKQKEAFISEMSEKIDLYLEDTSEKWIVENRQNLEVKAKNQIMESFMAGVKSLYEQHNMVVPEGSSDIVAEMQSKLDAIQEQLDVQATQLQESATKISTLTQEKMLGEASQGLTKIDKGRFEKLVEEVEFVSEEEYKNRIDVIREQFFQKRDQVVQNLSEDNKLQISGQPILEADASKELSPRMQSYLRALKGH